VVEFALSEVFKAFLHGGWLFSLFLGFLFLRLCGGRFLFFFRLGFTGLWLLRLRFAFGLFL
jgi:hypothetical protein